MNKKILLLGISLCSSMICGMEIKTVPALQNALRELMKKGIENWDTAEVQRVITGLKTPKIGDSPYIKPLKKGFETLHHAWIQTQRAEKERTILEQNLAEFLKASEEYQENAKTLRTAKSINEEIIEQQKKEIQDLTNKLREAMVNTEKRIKEATAVLEQQKKDLETQAENLTEQIAKLPKEKETQERINILAIENAALKLQIKNLQHDIDQLKRTPRTIPMPYLHLTPKVKAKQSVPQKPREKRPERSFGPSDIYPLLPD